MRTSDGSRYEEAGFPEIESRIATAPGNDETYYFGEDFTQKPFTMELAFDDIEEKDFRQLKMVFANKSPASVAQRYAFISVVLYILCSSSASYACL